MAIKSSKIFIAIFEYYTYKVGLQKYLTIIKPTIKYWYFILFDIILKTLFLLFFWYIFLIIIINFILHCKIQNTLLIFFFKLYILKSIDVLNIWFSRNQSANKTYKYLTQITTIYSESDIIIPQSFFRL